MSEVKKTNNKAEEKVEEPVVKKTVAKKAEKAEKKDNVFKRGGRKVKNWMSDHPFLNSVVSGGIGAGAAIGAGYAGKKLIENHRAKKYAAQVNDDDPNL